MVKVPSVEDHVKAYTLSLATAHRLLPADLCTDPLPALAAVIGLLDSTARSD